MTVAAVYYPHALLLPGSVTITQLEDVTPNCGLSELVEFSAGATGPQFTGSHEGKPDLRFSTTQISDLLSLIDVLSIAADLSSGNCDLMYVKGKDKDSRVAAATTEHLRARMQSNAFLAWEGFSVSQGALARLRCRLVPVYDGTNNPLVFTAGVANAGANAVSQLYTLGPISINSSELGGVESCEWNNNISYEEISSDGDEWSTYCGIDRHAPTITIPCRNTALAASFGPKGTALTALSVTLKKKAAAGINTADATEEHITFSASAGMVKWRQVTSDKARCELMIQLAQASAGGACFSFDTTSAIS